MFKGVKRLVRSTSGSNRESGLKFWLTVLSLMKSSSTLRGSSDQEEKDVVRWVEEDVRHRRENKCIAPQSIIDSNGVDVYARVFEAIDAFIWRAMVSKPHVFTKDQNTNRYTVKIAAVRGCWFSAFLYYMWKCSSLTSDYTGSTSIGQFKIPIGLVKVFQLFAPYFDFASGTTYRHVLDFKDPVLYDNYSSVDILLPGYKYRTNFNGNPSEELNAPVSRALIAATAPFIKDVPGSYGRRVIDYSAGYLTESQVVDAHLVHWGEYYDNSDNTPEFNRIQNLFDSTICIDDIGLMAPDGSTYTTVYERFVAGPVPLFDPATAFMFGYLESDKSTATDVDMNYLFSSGLPVSRAYARNGGDLSSSNTNRKQLISMYAFMTSYAEEWVSGPASALMVKAGELSGATQFSYERVELSEYVFATILGCVIQSDSWTGSGTEIQNKLFSMVQLAWSAFIQRMFIFDSVRVCDEEYLSLADITAPVVPAFYSSSSIVTGVKMPALIAKAISCTGPIVIGNKVIMPSFGKSSCINTTFGFNKDSLDTRGWSHAVDSNGTWDPNNFWYACIMTAKSAITLTYPGSSTTIINHISEVTNTLTNNLTGVSVVFPISFGFNMSYLESALGSYYNNTYPETYGSDRWSTLSSSLLGDMACMTSRNQVYRIPFGTPTVSVPWQNNFLYASNSNVVTYRAVVAGLCIPTRKTIDVVNFGTAVYLDAPNNYDLPLFQELETGVISPQKTLQVNMNNSSNSQFYAYQYAQQMNDAAKEKKPEKPPNGGSLPKPNQLFVTTSNMLNQNVDSYSDDIAVPGQTQQRPFMTAANWLVDQAVTYTHKAVIPYAFKVAAQATYGAFNTFRFNYLGQDTGHRHHQGL